jgi:U3 small nucleolar RNA-associated protein 15
VRKVDYLGESNGMVVSFSDDHTVRVWDVPSDSCVSTFEGHKDMVRAGAANPTSPFLFASGSYDHFVRLVDTRVGDTVIEIDTGLPVSLTGSSSQCYQQAC